MSVQGQRGRKVARNSRRPLTTFYLIIGGVLILVLGFAGVFALRGKPSESAATPVTAAIGRTADGHYYKGNPKASIKVTEYGDFQCPSCAFYEKSLAPIIDRDYVNTGKVQFIYHEMPLTMHRNSQVSAEASRCAGDQDQAKYWQMHEMLFLNQDQWAEISSPATIFSSYAGQLGLSRSTFDNCLSSGANRQVIGESAQTAEAAGISATPTFDVNGQQVDASQLASTIDAALRATGK
ncbi:MAG: thioredoxin domain-containing protein [Chloroflexales bacterium]